MTNRHKEQLLLLWMSLSCLNAAVAACMGNGFLTAVGCIATIAAAETYRTGLSINKKKHDEPKTN